MLRPLLLFLLAAGCDGKGDTAGEDLDGDGWGELRDCDDQDPEVHPGAEERPYNGVDDDCDDRVDDDALDALAWYEDRDGDGYGDPEAQRIACEEPFGCVQDASDCDDSQAGVHPGAEEVWDGQDNDCDGEVDEEGGAPKYRWFHDGDGDGFGDRAEITEAPEQPYGYVANDEDCDDADPEIHPGAVERCNQADDDCDGDLDEDDCCLDQGVAGADDRWLGDDASDCAGQALAGGLDLSGDGSGDLLIGAPCSGLGGLFYILPGEYFGYFTDQGLEQASSSGAISWSPASPGYELGADLALLPDIDGDGAVDFAVGSPGADWKAYGSGVAVLWLSTVEDYSFASSAWEGGELGQVADAGDVDRDGLSDLLLGGPGASSGGIAQGVVELRLGDASDPAMLGASYLGSAAGDELGGEVAGAGDLDGDGYGDIAMAALGYPAGEGNGGVFVKMGGSSWPGGPSSLADVEFALVGEAARDQAGAALAGGEDFDGDGYEDLAVGAPYSSEGAAAGGAVYVALGGPSWAGSGAVWGLGSARIVFTGEVGAAHAGSALALLPDYDFDGIADLAVGAPDTYASAAAQRGKVYLSRGSPVAWTGVHSLADADASWLGEAAGDRLGASLACAGDFDLGGSSDLAMGAPGHDGAGGDAGKVYLVLGW